MSRLTCLAVLSLIVLAPASAQPPDALGEALRLYSLQDWPASITAHEALVRERPTDAQAWLRLGVSQCEERLARAAVFTRSSLDLE